MVYFPFNNSSLKKDNQIPKKGHIFKEIWEKGTSHLIEFDVGKLREIGELQDITDEDMKEIVQSIASSLYRMGIW